MTVSPLLANEPVFATFRMQSPKNRLIGGKEFSMVGAFQAASMHLVNEPFATFRVHSWRGSLGCLICLNAYKGLDPSTDYR